MESLHLHHLYLFQEYLSHPGEFNSQLGSILVVHLFFLLFSQSFQNLLQVIQFFFHSQSHHMLILKLQLKAFIFQVILEVSGLFPLHTTLYIQKPFHDRF